MTERKEMTASPNEYPTLSLETLLALTAKGFFVFPVHGITEGRCTCGDLHPKDNSAGKHPVTKNGMDDATQDPDVISVWHSTFPNCSWAVNLKLSGLMVFDIDPRNGGDTSWDSFEAWLTEPLGQSWAALTGAQEVEGRSMRGMHLYYRAPEGIQLRGTLGTDSPGIDIKHNGYVLLPGSRHMSGVCYEWLVDRSPFAIEPLELNPQVVEIVSSATSGSPSEGIPLDDMQLYCDPITTYGITALEGEVEAVLSSREGSRNSTLFNSGLKIGSLISGGEIPFEEGLTALVDAALRIGLTEEEAVNTLIRRNGGGAIQLGAATPRGPKFETKGYLSVGDLPSSAVASPVPGGPAHLNIVDWESAFADESEELWLVPGLICDERSHAIYADAGLGKSLVLLEICAALASGKSALGLPPIEPMTVLYFDHENTVKGDVIPRLKNMGYEAKDIGNLVYSSFPEMDPLDTAKGGRQLVEIIERVKPRLVIIDTVSRTISGDENSNSTWLEFYSHAGKALKSRGIAYLRIDHTGKNADAGMRGGSAKKGDVDIVWNLTGKSDDVKFALSCEKSRVPLPSKKLELLRYSSPTLRHELRDRSKDIDWAELLARNERFTKALDLIRADESKQGELKGQKNVWARVSREAKKAGIAFGLFAVAHRIIKAGIPDECSEPMESDLED